MKRLMIIAAAVVAFALVTGFNRSLFDTNYTFDTAVTKWPDGTMKEIRIKKWQDYEGEQIQIIAKDGTIYLLSMNNTVLIKNKR